MSNGDRDFASTTNGRDRIKRRNRRGTTHAFSRYSWNCGMCSPVLVGRNTTTALDDISGMGCCCDLRSDKGGEIVGARWEHFKTVCKHKAIVYRECKACGIWWQGVIHDLSKFSPIEFAPSARYFQGNKSPIEAQKAAEGYSAAWQHHKGHNPHHWEYWTDFDKNGAVIVNMIPYRYVVEMVCDWIGAGKVYNGEKWTQAAPMDYYKQVRSGRHFHPKTEILIIQFLKCIRDKGLDEFHNMAQCRGPYSYLCADYEGQYVP